MSVRIGEGSIVVRNTALEAKFSDGVAQAIADSRATTACTDAELTALTFDGEADRRNWMARLGAQGVSRDAIIDMDSRAADSWLDVESDQAWVRGGDRGAPAQVREIPRVPFQRHEILSRSESGLHYVRERKSGILRQLTDEELQGFSDPPPCEECGEQFGCAHYNCARERLFTEAEIETEVPKEWREFAREEGLSRQDLERLRAIGRHEGEFRLVTNAPADMRTQELILLLNEAL